MLPSAEEKIKCIATLFQLCEQTQLLDPENVDFQMATKMCAVFRSYIVTLGDKIFSDEVYKLS